MTTKRVPTLAVRKTPLSARGEPMIWLTGLALVLCVSAIVVLLTVVVVQGARTFWPGPIERVTLRDGGMLLGVPVRDEAFDPGPAGRAALAGKIKAGEVGKDAADAEGNPIRRLFRTGNKDVGGEGFRWVEVSAIKSVEEPRDAVLVERSEWGVWIGVPAKVTEEETAAPAADGKAGAKAQKVLAEGPEATLAKLAELRPLAQGVQDQILLLARADVGELNREREEARLELRRAELRAEDGESVDLVAAKKDFDAKAAKVDGEFAKVQARIADLRKDEAKFRVYFTDVTGKTFAPRSQREPSEAMEVWQVVRVVRANALGTLDKLGVFASRWWEYLSANPREANSEGGIFPVIFGTVAMTLLLSVLVVPLGVIAALYLREYARQGVLTSLVRIAVNNLAGVPSIVYGLFGLGFFCYTLGAFIDSGATFTGAKLPMWAGVSWSWGMGVFALVMAVAAASFLQTRAAPIPGKAAEAKHGVYGWAALVAWLGVVSLIVYLVATMPLFKGFFRERLPTATFGTKGILWSALTLALLTLPVVIVATEEAISAVPRSLREGSYGCGASKWQTIQRIVLPQAAPGIMTGMILAMARGAGEVAPLMLVGAVKQAEELPIDGTWPYLHLERSFMHLGFHIYDLGFQSPDAEAARPLVWTTTLVLILIVATLNLVAVGIRAKLRKRFVTAKF